jgi:hypothetical protein
MKKVITLLLIAAASTSINAQNQTIIRANFNFASVTTDEPTSTGTVVEVSGRAGYSFAVGRNLNKSKIKARIYAGLVNGGNATKINGVKESLITNYVTFAGTVKLFGKNKFGLYAGPQLGYLLSAKRKTNNINESVINSLRKVDVCFNVDVHYFLNKQRTFAAIAAWNVGIGDVYKNANGNNNNLLFGLQYNFGKDKQEY